MSSIGALRQSGALLMLPVLFALGVYVGLPMGVSHTGYPVADLADASYGIQLTGPLVAAGTALSFGSFLRHTDLMVPTRRGLVVVVAAWWPLLAGAPVAAVLAMVVAGGGALPGDRASWSIIAIVASTMLACVCIGMATAHALPPAFAIPASAAGLFAWLALPGSTTNVVLRQLNSEFGMCCTSGEVPSQLTLAASGLVTGTVVVGLASLTSVRRAARAPRYVATAAIALVLGGAVLVGTTWVRIAPERPTLGSVSERTEAKRCDVRDGLRACVWPENEERLPEVSRAIGSVDDAASSLGLPQINGAVEDSRSAAAIGFTAREDLTRSDVVYSLVDGYTRWVRSCAGVVGDDPPGELVTIIGRRAGLSLDYLEPVVGNRALSEVEAAEREGTTAELVRRTTGRTSRCGGAR